ncbi:MAG: cytochrome c oxidase subunit 3 [bacterium]
MSDTAHYFVPEKATWPIVGSIGLTTLIAGVGGLLNDTGIGMPFIYGGVAIVLVMLFGWFSDVIKENQAGVYNTQVDTSFRMGMTWFIFSEVMFFAAFFGALFYARELSVPWLGGEGTGAYTNMVLWPEFSNVWPTNGPGDIGGDFETIPAWSVPFLNTLILLTSGLTITMAHWALNKGKQKALVLWLAATVALGAVFLYFQVHEYAEAYGELNLTLGSGIYGSTFFMLTGFHGMHVTLGAIMLLVITIRAAKGHFSKDNHFAFEAVAWYWHFVDVVWLGLFIFVYVI